MARRIRQVQGQMGLPFGSKARNKANKAVPRKGLSRPEIRAVKARAERLASQAYAIIRSPGAATIFQGVNPQHIESYRREFGRDIGALRKGRMSAREGQTVIGRVTAFFDRFGIKYKL